MEDFSNCKKSNVFYGGSERKIGIIYHDSEYMIKFPKYSNFGLKLSNHISEYLGSHIYKAMGFDVQDTILGTYNGEEVVACKNFNVLGSEFVPFNDVGESTLEIDKNMFQYSYEDVMEMLVDNSKLSNVNETINAFWEMYIMDALLGNFDRHGYNWGFIKTNNKYRLAPVFDNGSCLFPNLVSEEDIDTVLNHEDEVLNRVYKYPTSQIKLNGKKSSYYDVINSLQFKECNDALIKVVDRYNETDIFNIVDATPFISDKHKQFYKMIIHERFELILLNSYNKLVGKI